MTTAAQRILVLGSDKALAVSAFTRCAPAGEFINLSAFSAASAQLPGPSLVDDVDRVMATDPFCAIVATSESTMLAAGFLRSRYGFPGLTFDESMTVTNKWRMRSALRPHITSPEAWLSGQFLSSTAAGPESVVIKPLSSSSARGVRLMPTGAARDWLRRNGDLWLVEEAIPVEREFHCDGAFRDGRVEWVEMSEYDRPVLVSHGTRATSILRRDEPLRSELSRGVDRVVEALSIDAGVFHMEFLYTGQDLYFGEVGLRPAGTGIAELLHLTSGADLWAAFISSQLGEAGPAHKPVHEIHEVAGLVMARPSPAGQRPLARSNAAALPGVLATGDGNISAGAQPANMCEFEYLAFFDGLDRADVPRLLDAVSGLEIAR